MKYKIGQKVRVVNWKDMPAEIKDNWSGTPPCLIGKTGVIFNYITLEKQYQIKMNNDIHSEEGLFEEELEPIIKIGEQLVFGFMKEKEYDV